MENEQEGINLEAVNLDNNSISSEGNIVEGGEIDTPDTSTQIEPDNEKELLKKSMNYERKQRKQAERKNKELEARINALEEQSKSMQKSTLDKLLEDGVDENIAKTIATAIEEKTANSDNNSVKAELADMRFKYQLSEKSKENDFEDIMDYEDEIKDLVDKGLDIEQAYYALNYNKVKTNTNSEIQRKLEAKMQNKQARKEILGNINSAAGGAVANNSKKPQATAEEIAIAQEAGIDINDYLAAKKAESVKQYNDYTSKKVK